MRSASAPQRAIENLLDNRDLRLERAGQLLTAFSYRGVLERGFALVRELDGNPLRRAAAVAGRPGPRHRVRRRPRAGGGGRRAGAGAGGRRRGRGAGDARVPKRAKAACSIHGSLF